MKFCVWWHVWCDQKGHQESSTTHTTPSTHQLEKFRFSLFYSKKITNLRNTAALTKSVVYLFKRANFTCGLKTAMQPGPIFDPTNYQAPAFFVLLTLLWVACLFCQRSSILLQISCNKADTSLLSALLKIKLRLQIIMKT